MLNEWSDRPPPRPPRPLLMTGEFWVGVFTIVVWLGLLLGFMV